MIGLPASEKAALQWLNGNLGEGNWKPTAAAVIAYACMRQKIGFDGYVDLVLSSEFGRHLKESSEFRDKETKLESFLLARWEFAEGTYEPAHFGASIKERAQDLMVRVLLADCWPSGQTGTTLRAVALALVAVAEERGAYSFDCSARWLAWQAGISDPKKISSALKSLAGLGLIKISGSGRQLRKVELNFDWGPRKATTNKDSGLMLFVVELRSLRHDLFTRQGLGPASGWVWSLLCGSDGLKASDVATQLHLSLDTTKRHLSKLVKFGLAKADGDVFVGIPGVDLDATAHKVGASGYRDGLRAKFAMEQADNLSERMDWYSERVQEAAELSREQEQAAREISEEMCGFLWNVELLKVPAADPFLSGDHPVPDSLMLPKKPDLPTELSLTRDAMQEWDRVNRIHS